MAVNNFVNIAPLLQQKFQNNLAQRDQDMQEQQFQATQQQNSLAQNRLARQDQQTQQKADAEYAYAATERAIRSKDPHAAILGMAKMDPKIAEFFQHTGVDINDPNAVLPALQQVNEWAAAKLGKGPERISVEDQFKADNARQLRQMDLDAAEKSRSGQQAFTAQQAQQQRDFTASQNDKNRDLTTRGQDLTSQQAANRSNTASAQTQANNQRTWDVYQTAMQGLQDAMGKTNTGPVAGRMPAFTSAQQTAEGAESAMAPVLKQIFRIAGEGTFTDKDQELLMKMVPTRKDMPEARASKIQNIDNIIKSKLGMGAQPSNGGGQPQGPVKVSTPQEALQLLPGTKFVTPDGRVKVR